MSDHVTNKYLVVVGGPTASGKTSLAIQLANHYNTEIISADSRQFYKELNIGVATPSTEELQAAPHHFIGQISIHDYFSAGMFEREVIALLDKLFQIRDVVIMVGGSGLFIQAVLDGFHATPKDDGTIRKEVEMVFQKEGLAGLQSKLKSIDPEYFTTIDQSNPQRLMRAIERVLLTGKIHKDQTQKPRKKRSFKAIEIAIDHPRELLYDRINQRVDVMMKLGLLNEVKSLAEFQSLNSLQTVGYSELFDHLNGNCSLEEAIEKIKQNTRRYAKRQITWFKNKSNTVWFAPDKLDQVIPHIDRLRA